MVVFECIQKMELPGFADRFGCEMLKNEGNQSTDPQIRGLGYQVVFV